jgi:hypothetical protein
MLQSEVVEQSKAAMKHAVFWPIREQIFLRGRPSVLYFPSEASGAVWKLLRF